MNLFQTPEPADAELSVLAEIEELRGQLRWYVVTEPRRWVGSLRRISMARAIQGSNSIEGFVVTLEDAAAIEIGEEPFDASTETTLALTGYRNAMTYVLQLASDPDLRFNEQLLKSLHFMMTGYDLTARPGLWRSGSIFVSNVQTGEITYEGPPVEQVPPLMQHFTDWLNGLTRPTPSGPASSTTPTLVAAAMAHLNLVMIHPFRDGNGRMARCLQTLVLAHDGVVAPQFSSVEEYLGRNTDQYYRVLADVGGGHWQPERDARAWVRFMLTAHLRQATTMLRRVKESERLGGEIDREIEQLGLPERTHAALFDAAMGFRVRNGTYRASVAQADAISDNVASRDLRQLVDVGLLEAVGERRGRSYVASERLRELRIRTSRVREPHDPADPFAARSRR
jgi:Fic family protein